MNICDRIDGQIDISQKFSLLVVFGFISFVFFSLFDIFSQRLSITLILWCFVFLLLALGWIIYRTRQKTILLERDAKTFAIKLQKLIRVASQYQEHIATNFATLIELDLRLADAESAIEHHTSLIRRRKRF